MTELLPWCWNLEGGNGPDLMLNAQVTPSSIQSLAEVVANTTLPGYSSISDSSLDRQDHPQVHPNYRFIDKTNTETYLNNLTGKITQNIWIYNLVQIQGEHITIENGYGGRGDHYSRIETAFLVRLFTLPTITLQSWKVLAGGDGYSDGLIAAGTDVDSFLAHLTPKAASS